MKYYAIIVAGGKGARMKSKVPKQFLLLNGIPVLMHSIEKFFEAIPKIELIVVLPEDEMERWKALCRKHSFTIAHKTVAGGKMRFNSVKNGLEEVTDEGIVAVHDGVRPLASVDLIRKCFAEAKKKGNAVPVIAVLDSLRIRKGSKSEIIDRNAVAAIQTPQCFSTNILKKAYSLKMKKDVPAAL